MKLRLQPKLQDRVISIACCYLDQPYKYDSFNCEHFVRAVYGEVFGSAALPCISQNISTTDLIIHRQYDYYYRGYILYLVRNRLAGRERCSHLAIVNTDSVIHCSYYYGKCVVETPLSVVLDDYQLAS